LFIRAKSDKFNLFYIIEIMLRKIIVTITVICFVYLCIEFNTYMMKKEVKNKVSNKSRFIGHSLDVKFIPRADNEKPLILSMDDPSVKWFFDLKK